MPLEAGDGFISGLNSSNPVGSTDKVQTLDDHVRLIKTAVKGSFPNVDGAVNFTPAQANILVTDGAGAGMLADIAAIADPGADRVLGWDESANAAIAFSFSTGLTSSGTTILIDTTVVPRLGSANTFTANITLSNGASTALNLTNATNSVTGVAGAGSGEVFFGATTAHPARFYTNNILRYEITSGGDHDFKGGAVVTNNASPSEVGFKGAPVNAQTDNYTLVLTDAGKTVKITFTGSKTLTIPANGSVAFPVGTIILVECTCTTGMSIAITTDTLYLAATGYATTGTRTLAYGGLATLFKRGTTEWICSGPGVS